MKPEATDARSRALALLARREHTRVELARKLEAAGFERDALQSLLDEFEAKNWLSDRRFAESWVADHRAKSGSVKLAYELRQHGVPDSVIESVLDGEQDGELERARAVWQKKFGRPPADAAEKAKQMRFLQSRGFASAIVRRTLSGQADTDH